MPRAELLDPQGQAVERALGELGFSDARRARIGRAIELTVEAPSASEAEQRAEAMCEQLLANPVTEDFAIEVES